MHYKEYGKHDKVCPIMFDCGRIVPMSAVCQEMDSFDTERPIREMEQLGSLRSFVRQRKKKKKEKRHGLNLQKGTAEVTPKDDDR